MFFSFKNQDKFLNKTLRTENLIVAERLNGIKKRLSVLQRHVKIDFEVRLLLRNFLDVERLLVLSLFFIFLKDLCDGLNMLIIRALFSFLLLFLRLYLPFRIGRGKEACIIFLELLLLGNRLSW